MMKHKYLFVYLTLGIFAVFEGDSYFGVLYRDVFDAAPAHLVYGAGCFAAAAGAVLFLGLKRLNAPLKRGFTVAAFVLAALLPCVAGLARVPAVFWVSCMLFYIIEGVNAAVCAYYLHRLIQTQMRVGTALAAASVCGLILNYAADYLSPSVSVPKMAFLAACILAMFALALRKIGLFELLDYRDGADGADEGDRRRSFLSVLFTVAVAIAVMSYMIGVNDIAIVSTLLSGPASSIFIPQALLYLPGLLIAGILADVKDGRYLPIATLACSLLIAPTMTRLASPEVYTQYSGITYFLGGFYLIYIMISLVPLAGRSRRPIVVTSLAAFLLFSFSGLGAFTSRFYFYADSAFPLTVYIVLVALLLLIFYLSGSLQPRTAETAAESLPPDALTLEELTASYDITHRETEVLRLLIEGKSTAEIAEAMSITDKSVRNYISSLMSKTKSNTRGKMIAKLTRNIS
jgi:DNA-binding CsgD family transcriptional regulator